MAPRRQAALTRLVPLVVQELHHIAQRYMAGERPGHSLQATALVNEAYLRLINVQKMDWQNRAHFLAMAARLMRRILVDSARARRNQKRGGVKITLDEEVGSPTEARSRDRRAKVGAERGDSLLTGFSDLAEI